MNKSDAVVTAYKRWEALQSVQTKTIKPKLRRDMDSILRPYLVQKKGAKFVNTTALVMMFMLFCIVPYMTYSFFASSVEGVQAGTDETVVDVDYIVALQLTTIATIQPPTLTPVPTLTQLPTFTPSPIPTSTPDLPVLQFRLSFYDPAIGKYFPEVRFVNCAVWDEALNDCISKVNNNSDHYSIWYRRGVACPPPLQIGQRIRILSPPELVSINEYWTCIDRGGAIVADYLDFMLEYPVDVWTGLDINDFAWQAPVMVELLP